MPRPCFAPILVLLGLSAGALCLPAGAQSVTVERKSVTLADLLPEMERATGYDLTPQGVAPETMNTPREVELRGASVAETLNTLAELFKCDFYSVDPSGFRVLPVKAEKEIVIPAGDFRVRVQEPTANIQPPNSVLLPITVSAPSEEQIERIAFLTPDLRVTDNFGRSVLPPESAPPRSTQAPRTRLLEYFQRLELRMPDSRSTRIRTLRGGLMLYRKVTPLRVEFPLKDGTGAVERDGVHVALERSEVAGRTLTALTRVEWPETLDLVNRGLYRTPMPYVVDAMGNVQRPTTPRSSHTREGARRVTEQTLRFEELPSPPQRLVYEFWLKSDPSEAVAFRGGPIPLPAAAGNGPAPEQRPLYDPKGGSLVVKVVGAGGKPLEGEVTLGLVRKGGAGGTRWLDVSTDAEGVARLEQLAPGAYRVTRLFRTAPGAKGIGDRRGPVDVVVAAGKSVSLPPLQLPIAPPED